MTAAQRTIHASLETKSSYSQAAREGAALRGELGIDAQLLAMSAQYAELKAAGKLVEALAVKAEALKIYEGSK
jgi:hypothetical protein